MDHQAAKTPADKMPRWHEFAAKDIFRASETAAWGQQSHVEKDRAQIARNENCLRCCYTGTREREVDYLADGYHRLCAVYKFNEDAMIPCKIV